MLYYIQTKEVGSHTWWGFLLSEDFLSTFIHPAPYCKCKNKSVSYIYQDIVGNVIYLWGASFPRVHGNMDGSAPFLLIMCGEMLITQPLYHVFEGRVNGRLHPGNVWLEAKPCTNLGCVVAVMLHMKLFSDWIKCIYMARAHIAGIEDDTSAREISDVASCLCPNLS